MKSGPAIQWFLIAAWLCGFSVLGSTGVGSAADLPAEREARVDFHRDIRPILVESCLSCHGGVKRRGGLSFISPAEAMAAGKSGETAVVPGDPGASEFFQRLITENPDDRMPAGSDPLTAEQIETVRRWIADGADWPTHWAFTPLRKDPPPAVTDNGWARNAIDRFVLARLHPEGLEPSREADPHTLVRRLYLDLLGIPPSPAEMERALEDLSTDSAEGYERLVDRLLASPHFGERWGRHWLDLARYADTDGYEVDGDRPNAWHWRDWVIQTINEDLPLDQFTLEQLAGDLLPEPALPQRLATAFHRQTLTNKEGGIDQEEYRTYAVMDRVSTTAAVWFGLTLSCAQCHDHPYDPIRQREYYQWLALFNNADEADLRLPHPRDQEYAQKRNEHEAALAALRAALKESPENARETLEKEIEELGKKAPRDPATKLAVLQQRSEPRTTYLLHRGEFLHPLKDQVIEPGALDILHRFQPRQAGQLADRLDLARWIVDPSNALTPRVMVNQVWTHLFGNGLVRTPEDFGLSGEAPTHPELLDWLAVQLVQRGWSRKALIKRIVSSSTYRQSSVHRPELAQRDPENRLLHRQNRFRADAEIVRDLHLGASGLLASKIGGPSVYPPFPKELTKVDFRSDMKWNTSAGEDRYRRGMYTFFKRTLPDPNLTIFDCPDASATTVQRRISNTPLQALATLNNEVFVEAAQTLAVRLLATPSGQRLGAAFETALGRMPTASERERMEGLLEESRAWYVREPGEAVRMNGGDLPEGATRDAAAAWTVIASTLFNLDEFLTRE